jgi:hypothetical protein
MGKRMLSTGLIAILVCIGFGGRPVAHADATRSFSALALCSRATAAGDPVAVKVQIANHTGLILYVAYVHALATAQDLQGGLAGLRLSDPGPQQVIPIADGVTATVAAPWAGQVPPGRFVVALVVTSAGIVLPECDASQPAQVTLTDPLPTVAGEEAGQSARIAAETIGYLEAWRAYPALYALLHSDARAAASFTQVACWYAAQYGPPVTGNARTIYSTKVMGVSFGDWTWGVNGKTYPTTAEVRYQQRSGIFPYPGSATEDGTEHLVRVDGVWRWFFGTSRDSLANHRGDCNLPLST